MILEALAANYSVIHSDTDVAFLGNPLDDIKVITIRDVRVYFSNCRVSSVRYDTLRYDR